MTSLQRAVCVSAITILYLAITPDIGAAQAEPDSSSAKLFGDFRLRLDGDHRSGTGVMEQSDSRLRPRLRARFGVNYVTPVRGLSFGIRVATNAGTPGNSPHQTFDATSENVIALDRAFLRYEFDKDIAVIVGKQAYPHWSQSEVMWDEDIQPEGAALVVARSLGKSGRISANVGYYYLVHNNWADRPLKDDAFATWQVGWSGRFSATTVTLAVTGVHINDSLGVTNSDGMHEFADASFFQASWQVKSKLGKVDVTAGIDAGLSTADAVTLPDGEENKFLVAQLRGALKRYGLRYYLYVVQERSVPFFGLAVLSQDNFPNSRGGGLTGFLGHRFQLDMKFHRQVAADIRLYLQRGNEDNVLAFSETPDRRIQRLQANVNMKF